MTTEQAKTRLESMNIIQCIDFFNFIACDHYRRLWEVHEMGDESWWNHLSKELGAWYLVQAVLRAGEQYDDSADYFFYDEDYCTIRTFSTKQEFIKMIGEDFFIENLISATI